MQLMTNPLLQSIFGVIDAEQQRAMSGIEFARHDDVLGFRVLTPHFDVFSLCTAPYV